MLNVTPSFEQILQTAMQHHQAGRFPQAEALYRQILQLNPAQVDALQLLGALMGQVHRHDLAVDLIGRALAVDPKMPQAHSNLGKILMDMGRLDEALNACRQALALDPNFVDAYNNLGPVLTRLGQYDEARAAFRRAIELNPAYPQAHSNLGSVLADTGRLDEAIACFRYALSLNPHYAVAHSSLLLTLHYHPGYTPQAIAQEHRLWNRQHAQALQKLIQPPANDRDPQRRLKIGYVSPNFHEHAVAPMVLPLLAHHDPGQVEVFCYAQVPGPDACTQRFRTVAHQWRNTVGLSDQQMADLIRQDKIDILIDLAGHTSGNRLLVFAQKPAPVQITRQGYPNTTGLETIDYRMSDAYADPPGLSDTLHSETLIRLPQINWIYQPPEEAFSMPVLPLDPAGPVTFGCFNNFAKVTEPMLHLWARILAAVPGSRLLLKARALATATVQQRVRGLFSSWGLTPERLEIAAWQFSACDHLKLYHQVTIALDPFPYHGTTTTCEALWMGVPVITLAGPTHVSRVGVSLLRNAGLPELIADSPEEYLRIAVKLAGDRKRLAELRATLRRQLQSSPIMDAASFARRMEDAYRTMWRKWCATAS